MKYRLTTFLITLLMVILISCSEDSPSTPTPYITFTKTFGTPDSLDSGQSVQQTNDGGYIITGYTNSFGAGQKDVWLIKTDENGIEEWNKTFGGAQDDSGYSVQQTNDGGYIITGYSESYESGKKEMWLIKTDENGIEEWNETFGGPDIEYGLGVEIQQTTDGGYIITGDVVYDSTYVFAWLLKTDASGKEEWHKTLGAYNSHGRSVQQTTDGGYIVTYLTIGEDNAWIDVFLSKTDSNGEVEWEWKKPNTNFHHVNSVQQTIDGGYILTGNDESWSKYNSYLWLKKFDSIGNIEWSRDLDSNGVGYAVLQAADSGYIITGYTNSIAGKNDVCLIKTDKDGIEEWNKIFGSISNGSGFSVQQTNDDGFIITGSTYDDLLLLKTDPDGNVEVQ